MKKLFLTLLAVAMAVLPLAGCKGSPAPSAAPSDGRLNIVTTIFPPYDFARALTGGKADIAMLLPPGAESHTYEPAPQDIIAIQNCDLFVYVGGESDVWIDDILGTMGDKAPATLKLIDCVAAVEETLVEGMQGEDGHDGADSHGAQEDHASAEYDEHVWTAPANAIKIVQAMRDAVSALDADHAADYARNADAYVQQLTALDHDFAEMIRNAARHTIIVGDRFPFRYLADAYGLDYYAAFPGCSSETEASAATVAFLTDKLKAEEIPAVMYIEFSNHKIADSIAESAGVKTLLLHSCHNVTRQELPSASYLSLMRQNLETLRQALG